MKVTAKCHNYTGCVLAYRGDNIELDSGAALVCPECGKAVVLAKSANSWMKVTLLLSLGVVVLGGVIAIFVYPKTKKGGEPATPVPVVAGSGNSKSTSPETPVPKPVPPKTTPKPKVSAEPAEPPAATLPVQKIDLSVTGAESKSVRAEVLEALTRIDMMPNISKTNKDRLYNSVERTRSMGKIVTIPFGSGGTSVSPSDIDILKTTLESPAVMKLRDDPTAVFVILGYADSKGDDKKNIAISQSRADSVVAVMKNKCNVANVMHAVAMGSSKLLDADNLEKNRIVEVWAVLP